MALQHMHALGKLDRQADTLAVAVDGVLLDVGVDIVLSEAVL